MDNNEIWKPVVGYEELYEISNLGRLRNVKNKKIRMISIDKDGYLITSISKNNQSKNIRIHRLVAEAFIPNSNNLLCVNHKNEIKSDNRVENLEWCDVNYNNRYSKAKKVLQYDLNGKIVKEWLAVRDIVRELGYNIESITGCCNRKYNTSNGYIWRYKNTSKIFKLCYLEGDKAVFTNDFEHCWADDYCDLPYECNVGDIYSSWSELITDSEDIFKRKYINLPIELKELRFETNDYSEKQPCDVGRFSVEQINKGAVAWLYTDSYSIMAGTTIEDFISIIEGHGGTIYERRTK